MRAINQENNKKWSRKQVSFSSPFTLIELLVVIAIIGILASMLLPVLSRAREKGRQTDCTNNLKQMGIAMSMYTDENSGLIPPSTTNVYNSGPIWFLRGGTSIYVGMGYIVKDNLSFGKMLGCKSSNNENGTPDGIQSQLDGTGNVESDYVYRETSFWFNPKLDQNDSNMTALMDNQSLDNTLSTIMKSTHNLENTGLLKADGHVARTKNGTVVGGQTGSHWDSRWTGADEID